MIFTYNMQIEYALGSVPTVPISIKRIMYWVLGGTIGITFHMILLSCLCASSAHAHKNGS